MVLKRLFTVFLTVLLLISGFNLFLYTPHIIASPEPANEDEKPPISGSGLSEFNQTWYVDTNETLYYGNQTINITGDLIINSTGKLILYNVTLQFNSTYDAQFGINVEHGGVFNLTDTTITSMNNESISFKVYGNMSMEHCNVSRLFASDTGSGFIGGLEIYSVNVTVNNTLFHKNYHNIYIDTSSSGTAKITNNTINDPYKDQLNQTNAGGIIVLGSSRPFVYNNTILEQDVGIGVLDSSNPLIDNNTIDRSLSVGMYTDTITNKLIITNNSISGTLWMDAIWIDGATRAYVAYNEFRTSDTGVWYGSSSKSTIINNYIHNNTSDGIYIDASNTLIYDNVIENNTDSGIYMIDWFNLYPRIEKNLIRNNGVNAAGGGYGIYVEDASARITDNDIINNGPLSSPSGPFAGGGILVSSGTTISSPWIDNNTIQYNNRNGIDVDALSTPTIKDNTVEYSNRTGIFITEATAPLTGNTLRDNPIGIHFDKLSSPISHNNFEDNTDYGILLERNSAPMISDNTFSGNGDGDESDSAIFLNGGNGACNALIRNNDISNSTGYGINIISSTPTIKQNKINYNTDGIFFNACSGTVELNHIDYNSENGIKIEKSSALPIIKHNNIDYNKFGVGVYSNSRPDIYQNSMRNNDVGIKITGYSWPEVFENEINSNIIGLHVSYSRLELHDNNYNGNTQIGIDVKGTNFTMDNCSISNSGITDISLDDNSHVTSLNNSFDKSKVYFTDDKSEIKLIWYLHLEVEDDEGNPLVDGTVVIRNSTGNLVFQRNLPSTAKFNYIKLMEYSQFKNFKDSMTPHTIFSEKVGYVKYSQQITMDQTKSVKLALGKNLNPAAVTNIQPKVIHTLTPKITWNNASDPDGDPITYYINIGTVPLGDDVVNDTGGVTTDNYFQVIDPLSFGGGNNTYHITIRAVDGKGGESKAQSILWAVNHQPMPPKIAIEPERPNKITGIDCVITSPSFDEDNDTIRYTYKWYKNGEYLEALSHIDTLNLSSRIPPEFTDDDEYWKCTVFASDGYFDSPVVETDEVLIKNYAPHLSDPPFNIEFPEDTFAENVLNLSSVFVDDNGEQLTYSWNTSKNIQIIQNGSWISLKPKENWHGEVSFKFSAEDLFSEVHFTMVVTVISINDLPVLEFIEDVEADEDKWFNITFTAHDYADNDVISYTTNITRAVPGLLRDVNFKFKSSTGVLQLKPDNTMIGNYTINVTAEDPNNGKVNQIFKLDIRNVNDKPIAVIISPEPNSKFKKGDLVILDGSQSYDEDSIHGDYFKSVEWIIGDTGEVRTNLVDNFTFTESGSYKINLIITDSYGATDNVSVTIEIKKISEKDEDEGIIDTISNSPAAVAGISLVFIIILAILLVFLYTIFKTRRDKKKMVEAGLIKPEDLKKKPEEAVPQIPPPAPVPIQIPAPGIPGQQPEAQIPSEKEPPAQLKPAEEEVAPSEVETKEEVKVEKKAKVEEEEPTGPAWGPSISMESEEEHEQEEPIPPPEEVESIEEETDVEPVEVHEAQRVSSVQATPIQPVKQYTQVQPGIPMQPVQPMMPQVQCPDCGSPAQFHPMNKNIIICPKCGPMKANE